MEASARSADPKSLAGLPIAVKDYNDVGGVRTTYGSPIYADYVPQISDATIACLEARDAIPIAKSNVPEWAGGHTFNPVHGITRNPWNTGRSAGGSSGGSAAALASGQVWLATGNDWAAVCERLPGSMASSACALVRVWYPVANGCRRSTRCGSKVQWPVTSPMLR